MPQLLTVITVVVCIFALAYVVYARSLSRYFELDDDTATPAHTHDNSSEYVPSRKLELFGHHFSSIAGGAPIVGPITAALAWGWAPALIWIVIGTVVYGGLNDLATLTSSMRHDGRSVGHIFGTYINRRGKRLLLTLAVVANLLVIGVLSLVTAVVFDAFPAAATASVVYLVLAFAFALVRRYTPVPFWVATVIFVPAVFGGVFVGLEYPLTLIPAGASIPLPTVISANVSAWLVVLLLYAFAASVLPVWTLLQPRDYLSSYLLYAGLGGAILSIVVGTLFGTADTSLTMSLDPFTGFMSPAFEGMGPLLPMLIPTIFCGAVCGLHSMVCCGTTPKQINKETDATAVGYGTTLAEGLLAVVAIGTVAVIPTVPSGSGINLALPAFADGGALILTSIGIPAGVGAPFMALVLSAFALTTVDTSIRLGRYFLTDMVDSETTPTRMSRAVTNKYLTGGVQALLAYLLVASGSWATVWPLFGASVQVFAGLSMLTVAVWIVNWDASKQVVGFLLGAGFILTASLSALLYIASRNVRTVLDPSWVGTASSVELASVVIQILAVVVLTGIAAEIIRLVYRHVSEQRNTPVDRPSPGDD
ncbi:carbon starvation CstA family protein [Halobacteriaceae archaeon SHR40]|uniref:carbon starvation CstA family protein n=1 Tax=Halovenus amylolytica TaxID=2500550 RepID=UPI000FE3D5AB